MARLKWQDIYEGLVYRIKRCDIAAQNGGVNLLMCHALREAFKDATGYGFGDGAELEVRKLLTHGDNCREVCVKMT